MTHPSSRPVIKMRANKSPQRVRFGFPWLFADEVVLDRRSRRIAAGTVVDVIANDGEALGVAGFNAESRIACRMLDRDPTAEIGRAWLVRRLEFAASLRARLYPDTNARLVHAEADGLPGVIIDRFGDVAVIQPNAAWAEVLFDDLCAALMQVTGVTTIVKNATGRARKLEGLDEETTLVTGALDAPVPVQMNGATYLANLLGGQKTGLFYDQRDNQAFAAKLARGARVLDVFSHVGGFSLAALAAGASQALAVDSSAGALALAEDSARISGFSERFTTRRGDAFSVMEDLHKDGQSFDLVVCDPPAFAPSKHALEAGLRAYERVARMGAALVAPGGYLCLCSCSHAADLEKFRTASIRGIGKAHRRAVLVHTGFAGPDHPMHPELAESGYLKALFFRLA